LMMAVQMCYNRGCGKEYNIRQNFEDSCRYHPGDPYFHDAYKGWSCCQNKSTDFTTFLNTPGCALGKHSNVKPINPEKITGNLNKEPEPVVVETRPPIQPEAPRPSYDTPMTRLEPTVAASLKQAIAALPPPQIENGDSAVIAEGECCKNNGCKKTYSAERVDNECLYHPGIPVFHEGMKYWSCCQRKTTEFQEFMDQVGCTVGKCKWIEDKKGKEVECRYDWHQTATHVTTAVYAKKYDPQRSIVELSPVRLYIHLVFPAENDNTFTLDLELKGVVEVETSKVSMMGTKLEVKMKKAESSSWAKLNIPREMVKKEEKKEEEEAKTLLDMAKKEPVVDALDLDDLDITPQKFTLSKEATTKVN